MRIIPSSPAPSTNSRAEIDIFNRIKEEDGDWTIFHSLCVSKHQSKREAEIDFLFVGKRGIFAIEVKGGGVSREGGMWKFTNRFGNVSKKKESPFVQAKTGSYSIVDYIKQSLHDVQLFNFGYAVAFPDIEFKDKSPEWDPRIVFDGSSGSIANFLDEVANYWEKSSKARCQNLTNKQVRDIVDILSKDFNYIVSTAAAQTAIEKERLALTMKQWSVLEGALSNERLIIEGSAGTGKTLLALELFKRNVSANKSTALFCFNRQLARYLENQLSGLDYDSSIHFVGTIHSFMKKYDRDTKATSPEYYNEILPEIAKSKIHDPIFQELIIDEGQDMCRSAIFDVLEKVLSKGLGDGSWKLFLDSKNQFIYESQDEMLNKLKKIAMTYELFDNCRNTENIIVQNKLITGLDLNSKPSIKHGPKVKYKWYTNDFDLVTQLEDEINKLIEKKAAITDIVLLSPDSLHRSSISNQNQISGYKIIDLTKNHDENDQECIKFSTIHGFKGLEEQYVFLIDVENIENAPDRNAILNYVAMSRAKYQLFVFAKDSLREPYRQKIMDFDRINS